MYEVVVLFDGYSNVDTEDSIKMTANCSCTLIKGPSKIIVDTMTPWDSQKILNALKTQKVAADDITYVISTHGHSDHVGNNNLFLKAKHIVGFNVSHKDYYYFHDFNKGDLFERFEDIENPQLWVEAGSEDPVRQRKSRSKVADLADWIVPGHGPKFQVNESIRQELRKQAFENIV